MSRPRPATGWEGFNPTPVLPIGHYRFRFTATEPMRLPAHPGFAWRYLFGHALRKAVCSTGRTDRQPCLLRRNCVYVYLFKTPPPADGEKQRRRTAAPRPFELAPSPHAGRFDPGDALELPSRLIGRANDHLLFVIYAWQQAGRRGIGSPRGRLMPDSVEQESPPRSGDWTTIFRPDGALRPLAVGPLPIPPPPAAAAIELLTPLRLRRHDRLVTPDTLAFGDLFANLLRRISLVFDFHTDTDRPLEADFRALTARGDAQPLRGKPLLRHDLIRYSSRQRTTMQMGGVTGRIELAAHLAPFWPYLWLGQWAGAGKGVSMGRGQYRITTSLSSGFSDATGSRLSANATPMENAQ